MPSSITLRILGSASFTLGLMMVSVITGVRWSNGELTLSDLLLIGLGAMVMGTYASTISILDRGSILRPTPRNNKENSNR